VEAFDNTPLFTLAAEWQTAIMFYSVTNHIYQPAAVIYSKKFWDGLSADDKKILMGPGNGHAQEIRTNVRALGESLIQVLKESKVNVYSLSDSEKEAFKKAADGIAQEAIKSIGGDSAKIYALILEGKKAFKAKK
jgi:TRAP-type C4-dicarboxylate transport system substrate-binding protein